MPGLAGAGRGRDSGSWAPAGGWAPSFGLGTLLYFCGSAPALQQFISTSPSLEDLDFYKEIATYLPPWAIIMPLPHSTLGSPSTGAFPVPSSPLHLKDYVNLNPMGPLLVASSPCTRSSPKSLFFSSYGLSIVGSDDLSFPSAQVAYQAPSSDPGCQGVLLTVHSPKIQRLRGGGVPWAFPPNVDTVI